MTRSCIIFPLKCCNIASWSIVAEYVTISSENSTRILSVWKKVIETQSVRNCEKFDDLEFVLL